MNVEGCSSSESGWTMYIASPMQEDADEEDENDGDYGIVIDNDKKKRLTFYNKYKNIGYEEKDSDDSMASDASSGPTNHRHSRPEDAKDSSRHKRDKKKQQYSSHNNNNNKKEKKNRDKCNRRK